MCPFSSSDKWTIDEESQILNILELDKAMVDRVSVFQILFSFKTAINKKILKSVEF
jgi:hypothetical protein